MNGLSLAYASVLTLCFQLGYSRDLNVDRNEAFDFGDHLPPDIKPYSFNKHFLPGQGCGGCTEPTHISPITGTVSENPLSLGTTRSCPPTYPCIFGSNIGSKLRCCSNTIFGRCGHYDCITISISKYNDVF